MDRIEIFGLALVEWCAVVGLALLVFGVIQ